MNAIWFQAGVETFYGQTWTRPRRRWTRRRLSGGGGSILDLEGLTRIVVTHALDEALLRRYDGILVLKDGTLAECGRFEELMEHKGYFYSLYTVSQ